MELAPLNKQTCFIPEAEVQAKLEALGKMPSLQLQAPVCAAFKADVPKPRAPDTKAAYDRYGVAAFVCRHEFMVVSCSLFTHENHGYYLLMMDKLLEEFGPGSERQLDVAFMDIACQFESSLRQ